MMKKMKYSILYPHKNTLTRKLHPMLTDVKCRNAICPPDRSQVRFAYTRGMYLQVSPTGSKRWFLKYRIDGKEKQLAMGSNQDVSLTSDRNARDI